MFEVQSLVHLEPICQIEFYDFQGNLLLEGAKSIKIKGRHVQKKKKKTLQNIPL